MTALRAFTEPSFRARGRNHTQMQTMHPKQATTTEQHPHKQQSKRRTDEIIISKQIHEASNTKRRQSISLKVLKLRSE